MTNHTSTPDDECVTYDENLRLCTKTLNPGPKKKDDKNKEGRTFLRPTYSALEDSRGLREYNPAYTNAGLYGLVSKRVSHDSADQTHSSP